LRRGLVIVLLAIKEEELLACIRFFVHQCKIIDL